MRARTVSGHGGATAPDKPPTVVIRIDGALWAWIMRPPMVAIRLPASYAVPETHIQEQDKDADDLVRSVDAHRSSIAVPLPVVRGDQVTIGGMAVDPSTLDAIEALYPTITWSAARRWLSGRSAEGELVAIWRMTENVTMTAFVVAAFNGEVWACNDHFCVRVHKPEMLDQIRQRQSASVEFIQEFEALIRVGSAGTPARININRRTVDIGPISVPMEQFRTIKSIAGPGIEWRTTSATAPAVGLRGGLPLALIMPFGPATAPSRRSS